MNRELLKLGAILGLLSSVGPFAIDMYLPALPAMAADLSASISSSQKTIMVFLIVFGLAQLVYGPLSDQYGRKPPLYIGLVIFTLGSLGCAIAPSVNWLIAARVVQGVGAAALSVIPRAIVRDRLTGTDATRLMATIMIVVSVSPLFAPLIGSGVILLGSWRLIFGVLCILAIVALMLTGAALPESLAQRKRVPVNFNSMARGTNALFRHRQFMLMTLTISAGLASFFVFIASAPFIYTSKFGLSPSQFSIAFAVTALSFFSASQFAAHLGERFGPERIVFSGSLAFALFTALLLGLSILNLSGLYTITVVLCCANACLGLVIPTASVMAIHDHGDIAGLAASVGGAIQWMSGGVIILLVGPFFDGSVLPMAIAIAGCGVAAFIMAAGAVGMRHLTSNDPTT
jgi:DHA1 family bicyclomycin/chloramphenicol resistance-like MFS transporter